MLTYPLPQYCSSVPFPASRSPDAHVPPRSEQEAEPRRRGGGGGGHGVHPVHLPAQHGGFEEGVAAGGGAGERPRSRGAEDAAGGRGAAGPGVAPAVAAEPRGAGERERAGGSHVLVQVREQGRRGRRHLRQPGQGRLRPRRRRAGLPAANLLSSYILICRDAFAFSVDCSAEQNLNRTGGRLIDNRSTSTTWGCWRWRAPTTRWRRC